MTPLDYYLWGALKPETIVALKDNIREAIGEIQLHIIDKVLKNRSDRVGYCMASRGSHLNEIIFCYLYFQIKRKKFEKIFSSFFKAFSKKKSIWRGPKMKGLSSEYLELLFLTVLGMIKNNRYFKFFQEVFIYLSITNLSPSK